MESPANPSPRRWTVGRLMILIAWLALGMALVAWSMKSREAVREAARRAQCTNQMKQIAVALHNYADTWGTLPPVQVVAPNGRPLYSWRVLILPYIEQDSLYNQFRLDEAWDSPANLKLLDQMPVNYACTTHRSRAGNSLPLRFTHYLALSGPGTAFPPSGSVRFDQILDGLDETLVVVESSQAEVPWTAPIDLDPRTGQLTHQASSGPPGPRSPHPRGLNVLRADGAVQFLDSEKFRRSILPLSTISGDEEVIIP